MYLASLDPPAGFRFIRGCPVKTIPSSFIVLALFCVGCAVPPPQILVANIEFQSQPQGGQFIWREFSRNGKVRGSPNVSSEEYKDYMNVREAVIAEENIAEVWNSADRVVQQNQKTWQQPATWPGEGHEQITITFCHYFLGWQTLSFVWPVGQAPEDKSAQQLLELLREHKPVPDTTASTPVDLPFREESLNLAAAPAGR
jgi:hypothetical protein